MSIVEQKQTKNVPLQYIGVEKKGTVNTVTSPQLTTELLKSEEIQKYQNCYCCVLK